MKQSHLQAFFLSFHLLSCGGMSGSPQPGEILLRLHLTGLEQFRLSSAEESLSASVSTADASSVDQKIVSPDVESPLVPGHPLWMEIETVSDQPAKTIPLQEGYFEIALPREFLEQAGNSFEIQWIDFFR